MYVLNINNKEYKSRQKWSEITINDSIKLYKVIEEMPENLRELYRLLVKKIDPETQKEIDDLNEAITKKDKKRTFPGFYGKVLAVLSTIPKTVIAQIDWQSRTEIYYFKMNGVSLESIIIGLLHHPIDYEASDRASFKWGDEILMYPSSKTVLGDSIPFYNESALAFAESADMELFAEDMAGGRYKWATNIISILCRPEGEKYNEQRSLERAEKMGELTMDIFWDVFFCSIKCFNISNANFLTYLLQSESISGVAHKSPGLVGTDGTAISYHALLASLTLESSKKKTSMSS